MTDPAYQKPIRVELDVDSAGYIGVSVIHMKEVAEFLDRNGVKHWEDHYAVSVDGRPAEGTIYLDRKCDTRRVQELLDAAA